MSNYNVPKRKEDRRVKNKVKMATRNVIVSLLLIQTLLLAMTDAYTAVMPKVKMINGEFPYVFPLEKYLQILGNCLMS